MGSFQLGHNYLTEVVMHELNAHNFPLHLKVDDVSLKPRLVRGNLNHCTKIKCCDLHEHAQGSQAAAVHCQRETHRFAL